MGVSIVTMIIARYRLPPTLIDIARETKTSVSTVSRVLAGGTVAQRISRETRGRVLDAATRLGYRPNLLAQPAHAKEQHRCAACLGHGQRLLRADRQPHRAGAISSR